MVLCKSALEFEREEVVDTLLKLEVLGVKSAELREKASVDRDIDAMDAVFN